MNLGDLKKRLFSWIRLQKKHFLFKFFCRRILVKDVERKKNANLQCLKKLKRLFSKKRFMLFLAMCMQNDTFLVGTFSF